MRFAQPAIAATASALVLAGCSVPAAQPDPGPATTPVLTVPTTIAVPQVGTAAARTAAPTAQSSWTMPNLVGTNLQSAQDAVQALTGDAIFFTSSHDGTGAGRNQVVDRNWKVCTQNVRPGATITADTRIDFGAVKLNEQC